MINTQIQFLEQAHEADVQCILFKNNLSEIIQRLHLSSSHVLEKAISLSQIKGKKGDVLHVVLPEQHQGASSLILVGADQACSFSDFREIGGIAMGALPPGAKRVILTCDQLNDEQALGLIFGAHSRLYCFDKYRTKNDEKIGRLPDTLAILGASQLESIYKKSYAPVVEGIHLVRDLGNEPANVLTPMSFAERIKSYESLGLKVDIFDAQDLEKLGMHAMLGVAQGSSIGPRMVVISWNGGVNGAPPFSFVGKGVCFDSGGLSLKPADSMETMNQDMNGAAVVIALLCTLAKRKAKINAVGLVGLVENMPDGTAQKPGDIVKTMSGQTVEVLNTDAEGRLVLCDVLTYCQKIIKPRSIINLATLTGAIIVALGHEYAGIFSNNDTLISEIKLAAKQTGDFVWHMPFHAHYDRELDSNVADIRNIGTTKSAGSSKAAHFLKRFIDQDMPWMHIDIAGVAFTFDHVMPYNVKGATGYGVALLNEWIKKHEQ